MKSPWEMWKQGFDAWESATAQYLEQALLNPMLLGPAGILLTASAKAKAASEKLSAHWWGNLGLSTKRDQERSLHALNQIQSQLLDLEDRLIDLEKSNRPTS
ncbi:MAG: hypothetical protein AAGF12_12240 [Myxococcota bacterium]